MTIKPYLFNNYEGLLPTKPREEYKSYPANTPVVKEGREKRDGILMTIDLTNVGSKAEVCERFCDKLGFGHKDKKANWDALGDSMWFFPESSGVFNNIDPDVVHIRVKNINHVLRYNEKDYGILCEILMTSTDNSRFDNGFRIIVEAIND